MDSYLSQGYVKWKQIRPGFELGLPCPFPTTIIVTPRAPPVVIGINYSCSTGYLNLFNLIFFGQFIMLCCLYWSTKHIKKKNSIVMTTQKIILLHSITFTTDGKCTRALFSLQVKVLLIIIMK